MTENNRDRLKQRVIADVDFTIHDEIVSQLLTVIECPILKDVSDDNVMFNHQCYDRNAWIQHVQCEQRMNRIGQLNGTRTGVATQQLKDPRTGENFNIIDALDKMLFKELNRYKMKKLITTRIPTLERTEWVKFCPHDQVTSVNNFVAFIQILGDASFSKRENYNKVVKERMLAAQERLPTATPGTTNFSAIEVADNEPDANNNSESTNTSTETSTIVIQANTNGTQTESARSSSLQTPSTSCTTAGRVSERGTSTITQSSTSNSNDISATTQTTNRNNNHFRLSARHAPSDTSDESSSIHSSIFHNSSDSSNNSSAESTVTGDNTPQLNTTPTRQDTTNMPSTSSSSRTNIDISVQNDVNTEQVPENVLDDVNIDLNPNEESIVIPNVLTQPQTESENPSSLTENEINDLDRSEFPLLPNFKSTTNGQSMVLNILTAAKTQGYFVTLDYPNRTQWFDKKFIDWYQPGAMFAKYRIVRPRELRLRFRECENECKAIFQSRMHQSDVTGTLDETQLPLYYQAFCHYYTHQNENPTARGRSRNSQQRLEVVNRSLIGQQAALNSNLEENVIMNTTTAQRSRTRGFSEMASEAIVTETSLTDSASSNANNPHYPQQSPRRRLTSSDSSRRVAPNDGRSNRSRRYNVDFGMNNNPFLPPSTAGSILNDVNRVQNDFNAIASSISNLASSHMMRHADIIDDKIIQTIQDRTQAERNGACDELINAYRNKLETLNRERQLSVMHMERYYGTNIESNSINEEIEEEENEE